MAATEQTLLERLSAVQLALKAPKRQQNTFGNYKYRSCEDILEALKPLLMEHGLVLVLDDELIAINERYYIKASATAYPATGATHKQDGLLRDWTVNDRVQANGYAREEETKKGMDGSQITGAASSYARKYALNGLFLIDDTKDSDATNDHGKATPQIMPDVYSHAPEKPIEIVYDADDVLQDERVYKPRPPEPTLTPTQIAELMQLAKRKGKETKADATAFLDARADGPFTKLPASQYEAFKKMVIADGWKKPEATP